MTLCRNGEADRCSIHLPADQTVLDHTILRAADGGDVNDIGFRIEDWSYCSEQLGRIDFSKENIYALNNMCGNFAVELKNEDWDDAKISAVLDCAMPGTVGQLCRVLDNLSDFRFFQDVKDTEQLGRWLFENEYGTDALCDLEPFVDFFGYGDRYDGMYEGKFVSGGYVLYDGMTPLEQMMGVKEQTQNVPKDEMQMGGLCL